MLKRWSKPMIDLDQKINEKWENLTHNMPKPEKRIKKFNFAEPI